MTTPRHAITTRNTRHGEYGQRITLPAGTPVLLYPADNLPPDEPIKWWAHPPIHPDPRWSPAAIRWAESVGVGLHADDVKFPDLRPMPIGC